MTRTAQETRAKVLIETFVPPGSVPNIFPYGSVVAIPGEEDQYRAIIDIEAILVSQKDKGMYASASAALAANPDMQIYDRYTDSATGDIVQFTSISPIVTRTIGQSATIAPGSITSTDISIGGIATSNLADGLITTAKLADTSVTAAKATGAADWRTFLSLDNAGVDTAFTAVVPQVTSEEIAAGASTARRQFSVADVKAVVTTFGSGGGGSATNIGVAYGASAVTVTSSTGTNGTINAATTSVAGVMPVADKLKLDGIEEGAEVNPTGSEIAALYEAVADRNAFTDAEKTKLAGLSASQDLAAVEARLDLIETEADPETAFFVNQYSSFTSTAAFTVTSGTATIG